MKPTTSIITSHKYVIALIFSVAALLLGTSLVSAQPNVMCTGICDLASSPVAENLFGAVDSFGLWLVDTHESKTQFFPHENALSLNFDPTGQYIAVISCSALTVPNDRCKGSISLFGLQAQTWREIGNYDYAIDNVKFSPNGKYVAFQKDDITRPNQWGIQLIDLTTNETFTIGDQKLTNLIIEYAFDPQSDFIAISNGDIGYEGHVFWGLSVWKLSDQKLQAQTEDSILAADLALSENKIIFVKYDTQISVWNYQTDIISSLNKLDETVGDNLHHLSFSYSPTYLLAALVDHRAVSKRRLFIWDIQSGKQNFSLDAPEGSFMDLIAMSQTGAYTAYGSTVTKEKIINVWEKTTGTTTQFILSD